MTAYIGLGGRAIDTSPDYGSQPAIGEAIRASGVPRNGCEAPWPTAHYHASRACSCLSLPLLLPHRLTLLCYFRRHHTATAAACQAAGTEEAAGLPGALLF